MLSTILKEQTAKEHQQLEVSLVQTLKQMRHTSEYVQLLKTFYGYYTPIEPLLDKHINESIIPQYNERRKADLLMQDVQHFGGDDAVQLCTTLPPINNMYQALGVMYVLEGSTLGGQIITKMIMKGLNLPNEDGVAFYSGYGAETPAMWASFKDALNKYEDHAEEIVEAARQTFVTFKDWIELRLTVNKETV